ncbi:MAG: NADP-dependent malic enzyme [Candidatus Hodarchaeota archaeon]
MSKEEDYVYKILKKANIPKCTELWHPYYRGTVEIISKVKIVNFNDYIVLNTSGTVNPCKIIEKELSRSINFKSISSYPLRNQWNKVAVISDWSKVIRMGELSQEVLMPVVEGKILLFKYLGGVDAIPVYIDCLDIAEVIAAAKWLQPTFGGISIENVASPKCFKILEALQHNMDIQIPIWHDNQQGTATVIIAGIFNALKFLNKKLNEASFSMVGAGAVNMAVVKLMVAIGVPKKNIIMIDSKGILHQGRNDIKAVKNEYDLKWDMCLNSNGEGRTGDIAAGMKDTDMVIAASTPGPGIIKPQWIKAMADSPIVFVCANPIPEIWPWEAKDAGAEIIATGRLDYPNHINNCLGFPGIFRGTLDVMGTTITDGMCIAAAKELAKTAEEKELSHNYIIPSMDESNAFIREAVAVGQQAIKEGSARLKLTRQDAFYRAKTLIKLAREQIHSLMDLELIQQAPSVE